MHGDKMWGEVDNWKEDIARFLDPEPDEAGDGLWEQSSELEPRDRDPKPVSFRVVQSHGECPIGVHVGDVVSITGSGRAVTPHLCPYAESVLRVAAVEDEVAGIGEWCCPVYDHLLVFRRAVSVG